MGVESAAQAMRPAPEDVASGAEAVRPRRAAEANGAASVPLEDAATERVASGSAPEDSAEQDHLDAAARWSRQGAEQAAERWEQRVERVQGGYLGGVSGATYLVPAGEANARASSGDVSPLRHRKRQRQADPNELHTGAQDVVAWNKHPVSTRQRRWSRPKCRAATRCGAARLRHHGASDSHPARRYSVV